MLTPRSLVVFALALAAAGTSLPAQVVGRNVRFVERLPWSGSPTATTFHDVTTVASARGGPEFAVLAANGELRVVPLDRASGTASSLAVPGFGTAAVRLSRAYAGHVYAVREDVGELLAFDLTNAPTARLTARVTAANWTDGHDVAVDAERQRLYVASQSSGVLEFDLSNPGAPTLGFTRFLGSYEGVTILRDGFLCASSAATNSVQVVDFASGPTSGTVIGAPGARLVGTATPLPGRIVISQDTGARVVGLDPPNSLSVLGDLPELTGPPRRAASEDGLAHVLDHAGASYRVYHVGVGAPFLAGLFTAPAGAQFVDVDPHLPSGTVLVLQRDGDLLRLDPRAVDHDYGTASTVPGVPAPRVSLFGAPVLGNPEVRVQLLGAPPGRGASAVSLSQALRKPAPRGQR